jgi:hypothetical protein
MSARGVSAAQAAVNAREQRHVHTFDAHRIEENRRGPAHPSARAGAVTLI